MKKTTMLWGCKLNLSNFFFVYYGPFPSLMLNFEMRLSQELLAQCKTFLVKMSFMCMRIKNNALSHQWLCTLAYPETEAWCNLEMAYYGLLH